MIGIFRNDDLYFFTIPAIERVGGSENDPVDFQSYGMQFGTGDQDNYLKFVLMNGTMNNDALNGLQLVLESNGIVLVDEIHNVANITNSGSLDLYISINPATFEAQPFYSTDDGNSLNLLGSPIILPAIFLDPNDNKGLAVGMISTARSDATPNTFTATWDFFEVYENLNGILAVEQDPLDFGLTPVTNNQRTKNLVINNEGGPTDDVISITGITFTGNDASLFSSDASFPIQVNPGSSIEIPIDFSSDDILGNKSAIANIIHSGTNSPIAIELTGELTDIFTPIIRINAGGTLVLASDGGPNWEDNTTLTGDSYTVSSGTSFSAISMFYSERDISIPDYIDNATYDDVMRIQRSNGSPEYPMIFAISLPDGEYIANLYFANLYNGTRHPGNRLFSVNLEGERRMTDFDPSAEFGHRKAGLIQHNVTVSDGVLEIEFIENLENPLINAIEILGDSSSSQE